MPESRRKFLKQLGSASMLLPFSALANLTKDEIEERLIPYQKKYSANDTIRIAGIGMGIMGYNDINAALKVPGVQMVAACDLYTGRLQRAKEVYGKDIFTTRDYREILERKDIDAVVIATSDHHHAMISMDAMNKGKAVYCEKPMVHKLEQGLPVIQKQKTTGKVMKEGSQGISGIEYLKAKEIFKAREMEQ